METPEKCGGEELYLPAGSLVLHQQPCNGKNRRPMQGPLLYSGSGQDRTVSAWAHSRGLSFCRAAWRGISVPPVLSILGRSGSTFWFRGLLFIFFLLRFCVEKHSSKK